jgi:hypothetical protein
LLPLKRSSFYIFRWAAWKLFTWKMASEKLVEIREWKQDENDYFPSSTKPTFVWMIPLSAPCHSSSSGRQAWANSIKEFMKPC